MSPSLERSRHSQLFRGLAKTKLLSLRTVAIVLFVSFLTYPIYLGVSYAKETFRECKCKMTSAEASKIVR